MCPTYHIWTALALGGPWQKCLRLYQRYFDEHIWQKNCPAVDPAVDPSKRALNLLRHAAGPLVSVEQAKESLASVLEAEPGLAQDVEA